MSKAADFLVENGAFYLTTRDGLLESECRMSGRTVAVEMPEDTYFELDDLFDWTIMEGLMRRRQQLQRGDWRELLPGLRLVASDVHRILDAGALWAAAVQSWFPGADRFGRSRAHGTGTIDLCRR